MSGSNSNSFPRDGWTPGDGGSNTGGTSGGGTGGTAGGQGNICSNLFERTILNSPVPQVVNKLKQGDLLQLETQDQGRILVASYQGEVAGSVTSPRLIDFIECIQSGYAYIATVDSVNGGQCHVTIRPKAAK